MKNNSELQKDVQNAIKWESTYNGYTFLRSEFKMGFSYKAINQVIKANKSEIAQILMRKSKIKVFSQQFYYEK